MISNLLDVSFFSGRSRADAAGLSVAEDYVSDTYIVVRDSPCFLKLFSLFTLKALFGTPYIAGINAKYYNYCRSTVEGVRK